jgi:hypothetical protein
MSDPMIYLIASALTLPSNALISIAWPKAGHAVRSIGRLGLMTATSPEKARRGVEG